MSAPVGTTERLAAPPERGPCPRRAVAPGLVLLALGVACGAPPPPEAPAEGPAAPGPLRDLVPSGARVVVQAHPQAMLGTPALRRVVDAVFDGEARRALGDRTGVYVEDLRALVVAEWPSSDDGAPRTPRFLLLARLPRGARDVVRAAGRRMRPVDEGSEAPFVRRLGWLGPHLRDLTALDDRTLLVAEGVLDAARAVRQRVRGGDWAPGDGPALHTPALQALGRSTAGAPLGLVVPEPLAPPGAGGVALLLARQRALVARLDGAGDDVAVDVRLTGEFPPTAPANFRALVASIGETDLGGAVGISEAAETFTTRSDDSGLTLSLALPSARLATGLRVLFLAEIQELLGVPGTSVP